MIQKNVPKSNFTTVLWAHSIKKSLQLRKERATKVSVRMLRLISMKESKYNVYFEHNNKEYIYNSISKAFAKIDANELNLERLSDKEKMLLEENGFLIDDSRDELEELEYVYNKYYYSSTSLNIILTPTLKCNFNCPYCFEKTNAKMQERVDYYEVLKKYAAKYFKYYNSVEISLFGGEPLVQAKEIFDFLETVSMLKEKEKFDYTISITTNGSLLTEQIVRLLIKNNCRAIQITIDEYKEIHDKQRTYSNGRPSYDVIIANIKQLIKVLIEKESNMKFILRLNLKDIGITDVRKTLSEFTEKEREHIELLFRPIYETNSYKENNSNKLDALTQFYDLGEAMGYSIVKSNYLYKTCEACGDDNFFYLMPDLTLWKCINNMETEVAKFGYISEDGQVNVNGNKLMEWRSYANCFKDENCRKCSKLPDCFGGCILQKAMTGRRLCKTFEMSSLPFLYN